jgi:protein tyrosine/serine phosphatase
LQCYYAVFAGLHFLRAAVAVWHRQVLQEYLQAFQQQQPHALTYQQHNLREAAQQMRDKAQKAAAAAANFEQGMAQNYLRYAVML